MTRLGYARVSTPGQDLEVQVMKLKDALFRVVEPEVSTARDMDRLVVTVSGMMADMELTSIRDRQRAGIKAVKEKGVYKGRRKSIDDIAIHRLAVEETSKAEIARDIHQASECIDRLWAEPKWLSGAKLRAFMQAGTMSYVID